MPLLRLVKVAAPRPPTLPVMAKIGPGHAAFIGSLVGGTLAGQTGKEIGAVIGLGASVALAHSAAEAVKHAQVEAFTEELAKIAENDGVPFGNTASGCKKCGRRHRDMRFNICDICAFPNGKAARREKEKVSRLVSGPNDPMLEKLVEAKLQDILDARKKKEAGALPNIAQRAVNRVINTGAGMVTNAQKTVKSFGTPVEGLRKGWQHTGDWMGKGKLTQHLPIGNKSLTVAFGAATAPAAFSKDDTSGQNRSRFHRIARWTGNQAGGLIGAPYGLTGGIVGAAAGEAAGSLAGRTADLVQRLRHPAPAVVPQAVTPAQGVSAQ